ncbi:MAG: 4-alpha-glucanotransferase [Byssovorax sp.]
MESQRNDLPSRPAASLLGIRSSGVLLHPTSLPGPFGSGDLGREASAFVDFLAAAEQRWWQMLPVGPPGYGDSPYSAASAFAGSPWLIDLEALGHAGLLRPHELSVATPFAIDQADFAGSRAFREDRLARAFAAFSRRRDPAAIQAFEAFVAENVAWLEDWALFSALKRAHGDVAWTEWPKPLRDRDPEALASAGERYADAIDRARFEQHLFATQWRSLRAVCAARGVALMGDLPIFVAHDSADVWQRRDLFQLDANGMPTVVAGVPPDYFSATGQRWGNPLYRWDRLQKEGFAWWIARLRSALARFDAVRLDHFIGFVRAYAIPASSPTAKQGTWQPGPGAALFEAATAALGPLPLVAEDLGVVTPEVTALRERFAFPGIRVLQFAFGNDAQAPTFLPASYPRETVVYTGTHDNDTTAGWFHDPGGHDSERSLEQITREQAAALACVGGDGEEIHWDFIATAIASVADLAIVPAQDLLGLRSEARMNRPGTTDGNWGFRLREGELDEPVAERLRGLTRDHGRSAIEIEDDGEAGDQGM